MSIFRKAASFFNSRVLIEEIIIKQEKAYALQRKMYPSMEPHEHLAQVWLSRMASLGEDTYNKKSVKEAFSVTDDFSCVPHPKCIRALALHIVYKEFNRAIENNPKYKIEYEMLMAPVYEAKEKGFRLALYAKHNPNLVKKIANKKGYPGEINKIENAAAAKSACKDKYYKKEHSTLSSQERLFLSVGNDITEKQDANGCDEGKRNRSVNRDINDILSGYGMALEVTLKLPGGAEYKGEISKDAKPHGYGVWTSPGGNKYEGEWKEGEMNGRGIFVWPGGDKYDGDWVNGKKHGWGAWASAKGYSYDGEWEHDQMHGRGTYIYASGNKYEGEWKEGQQHGTGAYFYVDGSIKKGVWENGEFIKEHNGNSGESYVRIWAKKNMSELRNTIGANNCFELSLEKYFIIMMYFLSAFAHPNPKEIINPDQLSAYNERKQGLGMDASKEYSNDATLFEVGCYMNFRVDLWLFNKNPNQRESISICLADMFIELFARALGLDTIPKLFDQRMSGYGQLARAKADYDQYSHHLSQLILYIERNKPSEDYSFDLSPIMITGIDKSMGLKIEHLSWEQAFLPRIYGALQKYCENTK